MCRLMLAATWFSFSLLCLWNFPEPRQFLSLISRNNMNVQVKYLLTSSLSVLLNYADSVSFCSLLDGEGDSFDNSMEIGNLFLWNFVNGYVMFLRYNESVSFIEGSYVKESHHIFVFVNATGRRLVFGLSCKRRMSYSSMLSPLKHYFVISS